MVSESIANSIFVVRGLKVILSTDLSRLYGVEHRTLMQAVKRNIKRFPEDFMFQLTEEEVKFSRSQIVILKSGRGSNVKYSPYAFTQEGVAMLSGVLKSDKAIEINISIIRTFVKLREMVATHKELASRLDKLERKYDAQFKVVFNSIRDLIEPNPSRKSKIGFKT